MSPAPTARVLVGPTATGKTAVAHLLARRLGLPLVSADSMLVYRGMDIGTAKPDPAEREGIDYRGIDLVDPDQGFSTADWLGSLRDLPARTIVAGGTGLYISALLRGIDAPGADPALRAELEACSLGQLQERLRGIDPAALARLSDPGNPRRLIRAIERGGRAADSWARAPCPPVVGLWMEPDLLRVRIRARIQMMLDQGWIDEVRALTHRFPRWSKTAAQAIGYRELREVLDGSLALPEAIERITTRTARLAKRQRTWFRNQLAVEWVRLDPDRDPASVADEVAAIWDRLGPVPLLGAAP